MSEQGQTKMKLAAKINCAKCNRPVDLITAVRNETFRETIFTAHCHGKKHDVRLRDFDLSHCLSISFGEAFSE